MPQSLKLKHNKRWVRSSKVTVNRSGRNEPTPAAKLVQVFVGTVSGGEEGRKNKERRTIIPLAKPQHTTAIQFSLRVKKKESNEMNYV